MRRDDGAPVSSHFSFPRRSGETGVTDLEVFNNIGNCFVNRRNRAAYGAYRAYGGGWKRKKPGHARIEFMFFRRERPKNPTFQERLDQLRSLGFTVTPLAGGAVRVSRGSCAVDLAERDGAVHPTHRAGILIGNDIGLLVDGGFQKFFRTPSGKTKPGLADDLKGLHDFEEDLKEGLGQQSYYNESLGTVSTFYLYDRVKDRDRGVPKRVWE